MEARTHPDVSVQPLSSDVRFTPESGHSLREFECPLWAISGLMHRSKYRRYSITQPLPPTLLGIADEVSSVRRLIAFVMHAGQRTHRNQYPAIIAAPKAQS
jgi:hypothetical protein